MAAAALMTVLTPLLLLLLLLLLLDRFKLFSTQVLHGCSTIASHLLDEGGTASKGCRQWGCKGRPRRSNRATAHHETSVRLWASSGGGNNLRPAPLQPLRLLGGGFPPRRGRVCSPLYPTRGSNSSSSSSSSRSTADGGRS